VTKQLLAGSLVMAIIGTAMAKPASAQTPSIEVWIQDRVGLPPAFLHDVEVNVTGIFRQAGVTTVWNGRPEFSVIILSAEMAAQLHQIPERMGFAASGAHIAYVVDTRIGSAVVTYKVDKAQVMAAVIAHELGHLLLPTHAHAPAGIMRADWNATDFGRATLGSLFFMPQQAEDLRKSLILR
jgi:hypothetical protein